MQDLKQTNSLLWSNRATDDTYVPTLRYNKPARSWQPLEQHTILAHQLTSPHLTLLSFNIRKEKDFLPERMAALLALIEQKQPQVICLQENTATHMKILQSSAIIQDRYFCSSFAGQGPGFKVSVLSTFPMFFLLLSLKGRPCVVGEAKSSGGGSVGIGCVHLTSGSNAGTRKEQLQRLYGKLEAVQAAVVAGDFNMRNVLEDAACNEDGFVDCWKKHGRDPGITRASKAGKFRLDRCVVRGMVDCEGMEVVGKEVIPETNGLTISDHFGILSRLKLKLVETTSDGGEYG